MFQAGRCRVCRRRSLFLFLSVSLLQVAWTTSAGTHTKEPLNDARRSAAPRPSTLPPTSGTTISRIPSPIHFVPNRGQAPPDVLFICRAGGYSVFFRLQDITAAPHGTEVTELPAKLGLRFEGADPVRLIGEDRLPTQENYFFGRDPVGWQTHVPTFARLRYEGIYPGVDLVFHADSDNRLEYDFILSPGADPSLIRIAFEGASNTLVESGDVRFTLPTGEFIQHAPLCYDQGEESVGKPIDCRTVLRKNALSFQVGAYDKTRKLVFDPVLSYSTYFGGGGRDVIEDLALDPEGNVFLTGWTESMDFPLEDPVQRELRGGNDMFVTKLAKDGSTILFSTFFGGSSADTGNGIALGPSGAVYIAGQTFSPDFPVKNALQNSLQGESDSFLVRLDNSGTILDYSTYLGGHNSESADALAIDNEGNAYIAGTTGSSDFPTVNALQGALSAGIDAFIAKLSADGSQLVYSTYLGGSNEDHAVGLAVDKSNHAYVVGRTSSGDFPLVQPFQDTLHGGLDVFVAKVSSSGAELIYSTYLGGNDLDRPGRSIAVDSLGRAFVSGYTESTDFPLERPLQALRSGSRDAFLSAFSPDGEALTFSTYLGGSEGDSADRIVLDGAGRIIVAGNTLSSDFPLLQPVQARFGEGRCRGLLIDRPCSDVFLAKIDSTEPSLLFSTYLGGDGDDVPMGLGLDATGGVLLAGRTQSDNFPTINALQPERPSGVEDGFLAKIQLEGSRLLFPQFGDGNQSGVSISSRIVLSNSDAEQEAEAEITLRSSNGEPLVVDLNGETVFGTTSLTIPPSGVVTLESGGQGTLKVGSVVVNSTREIFGVILYRASVGLAGVESSPASSRVKVLVQTGDRMGSGVAVLNLSGAQTVDLSLRDDQGTTVARATAELPANGQFARAVRELEWDTPPDFSNFSGTLLIEGSGPLAAVAILETPGEFATLPVVTD